MRDQVTCVVIGAGNRGSAYARYAIDNPRRLQVVGVAEPREFHRKRMAREHEIPREHTFEDWQALADRPRFADAAIIATPDALHTEPAIALVERGYHLLLEKPMAPTAEECVRIVRTVEEAGVMFGVCHVLRYTGYTQRLKQMIESGAIGNVVAIQHLEPVGFWHYTHSYVRGNWRNERESSFMLLAKSCHDIDWIHYIMGEQCTRLSSFGHLTHFHAENRPAGASERCVSCAVEPTCPYSASRIYLSALRNGTTGWPVNVVAPEPDEASIRRALKTGPYGRCVYACDNDVVDNQTVILEFENGKTADFSMVAFTPFRPSRQTHICGTRGHLYGDSATIQYTDFVRNTTTEVATDAQDGSPQGGHGGGDTAIMDHFVAAVASGDRSHILSGPRETLESHLMVFAAERARREDRVVEMSEIDGDVERG